jgi:SAM-dependent methyltransferase
MAPAYLLDNTDILMCPACKSDLKTADNTIRCSKNFHNFGIKNGIPLLFWHNDWDSSKKDVTDTVKSFYEKTPFPDYEDLETRDSLIQKAEKSIFAKMLDEQIPLDIKVLEVGCGTGQLSNFLGINRRFVYGTDICLNSLMEAQNFKKRNNLERVRFYQMNLFKPIFKKETFSLVICNGVLHHTSDPFLGFQTIAGLVKKGGYILIGLYNKYGRIPVEIRRSIFRLFGDRFSFLDPRLRKEDLNDRKKYAWFRDQYKNPHESKHAAGEVLTWFDEAGFDFINSIPKLGAFNSFSKNENLFEPNPRGSRFDHFLVQGRSFFNVDNDNGLFLFISRKKGEN